MLLIITNVLLFNKIDWKIILSMILALSLFYTSNYSLLQYAMPTTHWAFLDLGLLSLHSANMDEWSTDNRMAWHTENEQNLKYAKLRIYVNNH